MAKSLNLFAPAAAAEPTGVPEDGGTLPRDPTTLDLDQLMDLRLRGAPPQDPDNALTGADRATTGEDVPVGDDLATELPADLTTLSLGELLNLRVVAGPQEDEKENEKKADEVTGEQPDSGEATPEAIQLAADAAAAVAAAAAGGEGEAAQGDGDGQGDGQDGEGNGDAAPPPSSGTSGSESESAELGQVMEVLPAGSVFVSAQLSGDLVSNAPAPQPIVAAPLAISAAAKIGPPPNAAPVARDDAAVTDAQTAVTFSVLGNDRDPDGATLRVTDVTQGGNGTVTVNPDGTLNYAPSPGFSGIDTFTYTISDGNGASSTARVTVTVAPPLNDAPIAGDDTAATDEDTTVVIKVLGNDTDANGDPLHVTAVTQGQNGQVSINADGTLAYTPKANFFGIDTFSYTISDGRGGSSSATVSLDVRPVNDAPTAVGDAVQTKQGQPVTFTVLGNDSDVDGDPLAVTAVTQSANGKVAINADGSLTYVSAGGFVGTDTITYTVSDGKGGSASGTVTILVAPPNAPPIADDGLAGMEIGAAISGTLAASDADHIRSDLQFSLAGAPAHGTAVVLADGTYTYAPAPGFVGTDRFTFTVTDPDGASSTASVTVTVLAKGIDTGTGQEFGVNTTTQGPQQAPAMAALADGSFVVAWESQNQDGSNFGVFAQRFDAGGGALGPEFQVNTVTASAQQAPAVAALAGGGFVIVWESQNQDGSNFGVFGQRFDAAGQAVGGELQLNTHVQNAQQAPDVAALANGGFVVVWESQNQDGSNFGIFGQRFDAVGQAVGGEFQVNSTVQNAQLSTDVAATADGGFVVVWQSQNQDGSSFGVYAQRYAASGQALGQEFRVNTNTGGAQQVPAVAALAGGGFVVVWESQGQDGSNFGVYGQRFSGAGAPLGAEFRINTETLFAQQDAAVVATADGGFVVVWESDRQDGSNFGVYGQRFAADGSALGSEFQINTTTAQPQGVPDVTILGDGSLAVSWTSAAQDGSNSGVYGRIFDASATEAHTFVGGVGNDSFRGGAGADMLSGGAGNDRLDGGPGADQLLGGAGDDVLLWDAADALVDGGGGLDTLVADGTDIDLTTFTGKIGGIEVIDLADDPGANRLTLSVQDVLDLSDTDVLSVLGTAGDSVQAGRGWTHAGTDGQGNDVYTQSFAGAIATLVIDSDILVNGDILT